VSTAELLPVAAGETWLAVFGGLIPILGIGAIGWIVVRDE
jgi:hypothetical protein